MRRPAALAAVGLTLAALGAVAAVVVASGGGSGDGGERTGGARGGGTAVVARRTLVDRAHLDGTLGYGSERSAMDRLGGTLTWLPSPGAVIRPGQRLFAVDGKPVILMDGAVPAWRALSAGVSDGVDVRELERNLAAFGYDPGTVDETFTSATAAAVRDWQDAVGLPETGSVELGRVVFLPGARRVSSVDATLGATGGSGGGAGSAAAWDGAEGARYAYADYDPSAPASGASAASATTPAPSTTSPPSTATTPAPTTTSPAPPTTTPAPPATTPNASPPATTPAPRATTPTTPAPAAPATRSGGGSGGGDGGSPSAGSGGGAATKVLTTTSTARVVTADLDAADQQLARVGRRAVVTLPDGRRVGGRIVRVGTVATDSGDGSGADGGAPGGGDGGGDPTLPLTIRLRSSRAAGRLDEAPVAVALARTTRRDVLAVPVAALLARSGGGYGVRVLRGDGRGAVTVPVEPGMFADGYVELRGGGVHEGDRVEVPR
jgi:hypothetical protein